MDPRQQYRYYPGEQLSLARTMEGWATRARTPPRATRARTPPRAEILHPTSDLLGLVTDEAIIADKVMIRHQSLYLLSCILLAPTQHDSTRNPDPNPSPIASICIVVPSTNPPTIILVMFRSVRSLDRSYLKDRKAWTYAN